MAESKIPYQMGYHWEADIPMLSWTILIYIGAYIFWIANYLISCRFDEESAYRLISAELIAKIVCFVCFVFVPATLQRPEIVGSSIFDEAIRALYKIDKPVALFPSIHCLTSWFGYIGVRKQQRVPCWYKIISFICAVAICISTLTTKQHVFWDVFAGITLAELSYWFVGRLNIQKFVAQFFNSLNRGLFFHDK